MKDPTEKGAFHIPSLDGIRAVSIAIVFVSHAGFGHVVPGGLGVTVFFFLSGFLISSLMRREFDRSRTLNVPHFYVRRVFRILPPFYAALGFALLLSATGILHGEVTAAGVALLALHLGNYLQIFFQGCAIPDGTGVYWSLAVEEHYYLTFPFVALWLLRSGSARRSALTLIGLAGAVLAWRVILVSGGAPEVRTYYASDTRVDSILWGAVLAFCKNPVLDGGDRASSRGLRLALLAGGLALLLASLLVRSPYFRETYRYTLQGIALLPLFYYAVKDPDWGPFRLLNTRVMMYIGALSYTLYLVHHVVLHAVDDNLPTAPLFARLSLAAAVSIGLAALSHRYLEQPLARLRRKYQG